jgi:ribulose-5-phosphate 4-epimerase/fuculose-1-phosphate aldolase
MTRKSIIDQAMRASVERAMALQPRKAERVADELLYSVPAERDAVAAIRAAGTAMVEARLALPTAGAVAVQSGSSWMTVTQQGTDLTRIDGRHLIRLGLGDDELPDDAPAAAGLLRELIRAGTAAAVWAHPVWLLAGAAAGIEPDRSVSSDLAALAATVTVIPGRGVVAAGHDPQDAVARLDAAERLAEITIAARRMHG